MQIKNLLLIATLGISTVPVTMTAFAEEGREKAVQLNDIPAAARDGLLREAKGAQILKVEVEHEKNRTLYEGHIMQGKEEIGITVDAKGTLVGRHSEKSERKEKSGK